MLRASRFVLGAGTLFRSAGLLLSSVPRRFAWAEISVAERYEKLQMFPPLFSPPWPEQWFAPEFLDLVEAAQEHPNATYLVESGLLTEEIEGVFSFPMFSSDFCDMFLQELDNFYATKLPARRPNSMNNYGIIVNEIGMKDAISAVQRIYIWPLASVLYPAEGSEFHNHHSFMVRYKAQEDAGLDMHTDDSDVTLNVCLGREGFEAAGLTFCGVMGTGAHRHLRHRYRHRIGRAVIHLGQVRHGADDIQGGERNNLIIWNHNLAFRNSEAYQRRQLRYEREAGPPSPECLSYTHDKDWATYRGAYPPGKEDLRNRGWCPPRGKEHIAPASSASISRDL